MRVPPRAERVIKSLKRRGDRKMEEGKVRFTYREVNRDIITFMTKTGPLYYVIAGFLGLAAVVLFFVPWLYQIYVGQGVTGLNSPVFWGVYLVNFIFWVGIALGTLISAMLITKTPWRRAIARAPRQ